MKKTKIAVVGDNRVQAGCNCGWKGLIFTGDSGLSPAIQAASDELRDHKCPPKPKKTKKKKVKDA